MAKVKIISLEDKKEEQRLEEMAMTPEERLELGFQLIELAISLSPNQRLRPYDDGTINWIDLKELYNEIS